jgi:hypothetical protein
MKKVIVFLICWATCVCHADNNVAEPKKLDNPENLKSRTKNTQTQTEKEADAAEFDGIFEMAPKSINRYVLLKEDIKSLREQAIKAKKEYKEIIELYQLFSEKENKYNTDKNSQMLDKFDSWDLNKQIHKVKNKLDSINRQLNDKTSELTQLKNNAIEKYKAGLSTTSSSLIQRIAEDPNTRILAEQEAIIIDSLATLENDPEFLSKLLKNKHFKKLLPDYLKEQLNMLNEENIDLLAALKKPAIMNTFLKAIKGMEKKKQTTGGGNSINLNLYKGVSTLKNINVNIAPIYVDSGIGSANIDDPNMIALFELPIPDESIVKTIADAKQQQTDINNNTSIYSFNGEYDITSTPWDDLIATNGNNISNLTNDIINNISYAPPQENILTNYDFGTATFLTFLGDIHGKYHDDSEAITGNIRLDAVFNGNQSELSGNIQIDNVSDNFFIGGTTNKGSFGDTPAGTPFAVDITDLNSNSVGNIKGHFYGVNEGTNSDLEAGGIWGIQNLKENRDASGKFWAN